jgi:hypothetical protein
MNALFWGLTIGAAGKVLVVVGVLLAHSEIAHEHRIDAKVLRVFKTERWLTILGLVLIVVGYLLEMYFYGFTHLLECTEIECAAAVQNALQSATLP